MDTIPPNFSSYFLQEGLKKGCGIGIVRGRTGGCGIEGTANRVVRNGIRDGLVVSVSR